jgi:hypothetical protein
MQNSNYGFIGKLIAISAIVALGIKEIGPQLAIPATQPIVLALVLLPTVLMGLILGLQYRLERR